MDFTVRIGHNLVHKIQKLAPTSPVIVRRLDLAGGDLKFGEQGMRAVTFIAVAESIHRPAVGDAQLSLSPF
jgi:hypothetical protein